MIISIGLFLASFVLLWIGSGLAVTAITKISHSLRMSSFFISFFVLGLFTSLTEIMVGISAVIEKQPELFVGNLIGSSAVVFLLTVPILAILGNGVSLNHTFKFKDLVLAAIVVGFPALLTLDNKINAIDAIVCIIVYTYYIFTQEKKNGYLQRLVVMNLARSAIYFNVAKILVAVGLVFIASYLLVTQTTILAITLGVSPYIISILVISIGTNIPEISIAIRALLAKKKDIAFGNYVGSASLNTLILGILSLLSGRTITAEGSNYSIITFIIGLAVFLYFGKSRSTVSRVEGIGLLICYFLFVVFELSTGPGWKF